MEEAKSRTGKKVKEGFVGPRRLGSLSSQDILSPVQQVIQGRNRTGREPVVPVLTLPSKVINLVFFVQAAP